MPSYKLTYFNGRGRAEVVRLLFAAAGQKFEDNRIESAAWGDLKAKTPQGSMPILEIDGKVTMCQSQAMCRHLAREFKLYGKNNQEAAVIDQLMDTCLDLFTPFITIAFNSDKEEQAKQFKTFAEEKAPKMLGFLENLMCGKNGFCVGQTVSVADFCIFTVLQSVIQTLEEATKIDLLGKCPKISAMKKAVEGLPKIKDYLAKRPETSF